MGKIALVLGGGAPNFTLMTGALLAFDEAGVKFDVISGAGGGGGVALSYLAPKGMSRQDMLKNSVNLGVSDAIYRYIPMNYKVFQKGGQLADWYRRMLTKMPGYHKLMNQYGMTKKQKLISDLIQMMLVIANPGFLNPFAKGLCAHAPFVSEMVDFEALKSIKEDVYLNAYCITDHKMVIFTKDEITPKHFGATLSYPFIYPPTEIDGKLYVEGAAADAFNAFGMFDHMRSACDAFNFWGLLEHDHGISTVVVFDAFGHEGYIQPPANLWQAWGQSLILPLITLTRRDLAAFETGLKERQRANPDAEIELIKVQFNIPSEWLPTGLDWSSSNLERMFELGYDTGKRFVERHGIHLGSKYQV